MSADNGIYVLHTKGEWRVAYGSAIDNIYFNITKGYPFDVDMILDYFGKSKVFTNREEAWEEAYKQKQADWDETCYPLEYGVEGIEHPEVQFPEERRFLKDRRSIERPEKDRRFYVNFYKQHYVQPHVPEETRAEGAGNKVNLQVHQSFIEESTGRTFVILEGYNNDIYLYDSTNNRCVSDAVVVEDLKNIPQEVFNRLCEGKILTPRKEYLRKEGSLWAPTEIVPRGPIFRLDTFDNGMSTYFSLVKEMDPFSQFFLDPLANNWVQVEDPLHITDEEWDKITNGIPFFCVSEDD